MVKRKPKVLIIEEFPRGRNKAFLDELLYGIGLTGHHFTSLSKVAMDESPSAKEVKVLKEALDLEIAELNPTHILTLGATVLKALSRKSKITELHGQTFDHNGAICLPTFSPAVAMRDPARLPGLRKDIAKFGHLLSGTQDNVTELHWGVIRNMAQWNTFIEEFKESEEVAIDIETTGLDPDAPGSAINTIQFSLSATDKNWSLPLCVRDGPWSPDQQRIFMDTLFEQAIGKVVIGQNFKFDNRWLYRHYGNKFYLSFDTMLAHHILDENSPHGLKELASEFCNAPSYDVDLKTKLGLGDLEKFYKYGCWDTHWTRMLYYIFRKRILTDATQRRLFYKLVMPSARMMEDVESDGHFIDMNRLEAARMDLTTRRDAALARMTELADEEVNWNSPAQVGKLFYEKLNLPVLETTAGGSPSTGESVLLRLQHKHELPKLLMEFRGIDKNLSTYINGWKELMHGDRLCISTKLHGTVTGRWASRLHQVPRDPMIRSLIGSPPGWTFVCSDFSQIELRIAALLSNDHRMKSIFQAKGDIHSNTASFILGKPIDKLTKEERKMAKAVNFGLLYGMGWPKLVVYARDNYGVDMTDAQAQAFRTRYFEIYSSLPVWHERQRRVVRALGQVSSLSGRIRHLPGVHSSEKGIRAESERQAINSPVQGFGSGDLKVMAMLEIHQTLPWEEVRIKGEVHDSILLWVRSDTLDRNLPQIKNIMEAPKLLRDFKIAMNVPLVADVEYGSHWGISKTWSSPTVS